MSTIRSFPPIADGNSRVLILGTMPGRESLARNEYYAHARNVFWRILCELFDSRPDLSYAEKKALLSRNRIAIWDVAEECSRENSGDVNIKNIVPNHFNDFFRDHPEIAHVFFNGKKAGEIFEKQIILDPMIRARLKFTQLPSTSPANAIHYNIKLEKWCVVKESVQP